MIANIRGLRFLNTQLPGTNIYLDQGFDHIVPTLSSERPCACIDTYPENTRCCTNVGLMLTQRRRW